MPVSPATAGMLTPTPLTEAEIEPSVTACENQPGWATVTTAPGGIGSGMSACWYCASSTAGVMDVDCCCVPPTATETAMGAPSESPP